MGNLLCCPAPLTELRLYKGTETKDRVVAARWHASADLGTKYEVTREQLGSGMNGAVLLAKGKKGTRTAGRKFAIKTFRRFACQSDYKREASIYLLLDHPNIARLEDIYEDYKSLHLVMECLEGGELYDEVIEATARGGFTEEMAKDICRQMVTAIAYLHRQEPPILHRDIKPENFMFEKKYVAGTTSPSTIKLIDFGLSSRTSENGCGTPMYSSPEQWKTRNPYTMKDDMFSIGVTAYVLLTGQPAYTVKGPIPPFQVMYDRLDHSYKIQEFQCRSPDAQSFVKSLMEYDGVNRPSAVEALEHPWLKAASSTAPAPAISNEAVKSMCDFMAASCFRRTCLNMMAWSLTSADRTLLMKRFEKLDTKKNGMVSMAKIRDVLNDTFDLDEKAHQDFEKLSAASNLDTEVSYSELLAMVLNDRVIRHQDALWGAFERFDVKGEGFVTIDGLKNMFGDTIEGVTIEDVMKEVGTAGTGRISKQDFFDYLTGTSADPSSHSYYDQQSKTRDALERYRHILLRSAEKTITKELKAANELKAATTDDFWDAGKGAKWVPLKRKAKTFGEFGKN